MPIHQVQGDMNCVLCDEQLEINYLHCGEHDISMGACEECGLPYAVRSPKHPTDGDVLTEVDPLEEPGDRDWGVIKQYYEKTGRQAVTIVFDYSDEQAEKFDRWANEEFDMYWGMDFEEAKENGFDPE